jgi:hypothetical protein
MNLTRDSLEEFFVQQLQQRGITSSHWAATPTLERCLLRLLRLNS